MSYIPSREQFNNNFTWQGRRLNNPNQYYDAFVKKAGGKYYGQTMREHGLGGFTAGGAPLSAMEQMAMNQYNEAKNMEAARQRRISEGTSAIDNVFAQFDDSYYEGGRDAYMDWANPQLTDQKDNAFKEMGYALARAGLTNSSSASDKLAEWKDMYEVGEAKLKNTGLNIMGNAKQAVADEKQNLMAQLNATASADNAVAQSRASAGISASALASAIPQYDTLGDFFFGLTPGIGQAIGTIGGGIQSGYNNGPNPGSPGGGEETIIT